MEFAPLHSVEIAKLAEQVLASDETAKQAAWQVIAELPALDRERVLAALVDSDDDDDTPTVSLQAIAAAGIEPVPAADTARHTRHGDPRDTPTVALATALVDGGEQAARAAGGIHPAIWRAMTVGTTRGTASGARRVSDVPTYERGGFSPTRVARVAGLIGDTGRLSPADMVQVQAAIARLLHAAQDYAARVIVAAADTHDAPAVREFCPPACRCTGCTARRAARRATASAGIGYALEFAPAVDPATGDLVGMTRDQVRALYDYSRVRSSQARQRAHLPSADERRAARQDEIQRGVELARLIDERRAARRSSAAAPAAPAPAAGLAALLG